MPSPDRIWLRHDSEPSVRTHDGNPAILWLDPAEYLSAGALSGTHTLTIHESHWLYAAPETISENAMAAAAGACPSSWASRAIYALGCLAYRLRFGHHAFAAAKDDQIRSRQQRFEPPELNEAVTQGAAGDPLLRVLAYAMAKNPQSRFASFDAFAQALSATLALATSPPAPAAKNKSSVAPKPASRGADSLDKLVRRTSQPAFKQTDPPQEKSPTTLAPTVATSAGITDQAAATRQANPSATTTPAAAEPVAVEPATTMNAAVEKAPSSTPASIPKAAHRHPRRPSRRRAAWYVLGCLWIPIILLIVALALQDPNATQPIAKRTRPPIPAVIPSVGGSPLSRPRTRPGMAQPRHDNDDVEVIEIVTGGQMLWASPSAMAAPEENQVDPMRATMLLPPGPAALTTFNLPNLDATGLREAFDPDLSPLWEQLQERIAVPIDDVRLLALAWFPGVGGVPEIAIAVHLKKPRPLEELTEAWQASLAVVPGGAKIYAGDDPAGDAYYPHLVRAETANSSVDESSSADDGVQQVDAFAIGSIARVTQVAEVEGAPVLLPRQLEELWRAARPTDAVTMLSVPYFMIADSRAWINQTAPALLDWFRATLTPECGGFLVRVVAIPDSSYDDADSKSLGSYVELRLATSPGKDPAALKDKVLARIDDAAVVAEEFLVGREVDPSWQGLAARLPSMWMFTGEQIRSAAIQREVIFNAYLPPYALPQLTLGTLLAANTTATTTIASGDQPVVKLTLEQMLDRPMSVSFGQESLQFALDTIVSEFAADLPAGNPSPKVEIIGGDLQKMGITQNQQVRNFDKKDLPLRTVLTDLMLGANPDRTATGPADPKQALVWVVVGSGAAAEIKVTTREAAQGKYELPEEFRTPE